jgi:hypothetical protein
MSTETYQGKPCAHGHDGTRYASNRKCVACSRREVRFFALLDGDVYATGDTERSARLQAPEDAELWRATRVK